MVLKSGIVREAPMPKGKLLMTLPAKREIKATGQAAVDGWWEIDIAGAPGYIRETAVSVKGAGPAKAAAKPEQPDNVREYNKVVLEARDEGPDRMKTLLTSFQ